MGGANAQIDVESVGLGAHGIGLGAQGLEDRPCDVPGAAVGAVQTYAESLEGEHAQGDQVADVAVAAGCVVHRAADPVSLRAGDVVPLLTEELQLSVQVVLNIADGGLVHLLAVAVEKLDTVVVIRIVAGGDHDAAVEILCPGHIADGGGRGHMEQIGIGAGGRDAAHQAVFKHIAGPAGILADDDAGRGLLALLSAELPVIPAQKTADLVGVLSLEVHIGLAPESICAEIPAHFLFLLSGLCRSRDDGYSFCSLFPCLCNLTRISRSLRDREIPIAEQLQSQLSGCRFILFIARGRQQLLCQRPAEGPADPPRDIEVFLHQETQLLSLPGRLLAAAADEIRVQGLLAVRFLRRGCPGVRRFRLFSCREGLLPSLAGALSGLVQFPGPEPQHVR